jgi:hypoxia up-regulated 1
MIFGPNTNLGAKKLMTFKRSTDFTFKLVYKDTELHILSASVSGVEDALKTLNENGKRFIKGPVVKAVLKIDTSGMISVGEVYVSAEMTKKKESFLGKIFGSGDGEKEGDLEDTTSEVRLLL